jgi:membrane protease YdiL (CAAX protease family)
MAPLGAFLGFIVTALLASAALHYPLFLLLGQLGDVRPHKILTRTAMVLAALGLLPLLRRLGLARRAALGLDAPSVVLRHSVLRGWVIGVAMLGAMGAILVASGARPWSPGPLARLPGHLAAALLAGLLVAVIEETFLRGAMYGAIRRRSSPLISGAATALVYALLHFLRPPALPAGMEVGWSSGLWLLAHGFDGLWEKKLWDSLVALFAVGFFLAMVRERTGHIGWCIGLHAGWVFVIKLLKEYSSLDDDAPAAMLVGGYDGVTGWLAAAWIGVPAVVLWVLARRPQLPG